MTYQIYLDSLEESVFEQCVDVKLFDDSEDEYENAIEYCYDSLLNKVNLALFS